MMSSIETTSDLRRRLRLAPSGGEAAAATLRSAARATLTELLDAESRLPAQAVGEHPPHEPALRVDALRARRAALESW